MMIQALIFDMDGVLLDSEPFWRTALRHELAWLGVSLTEAEAAETMGIRIDKVLEYRQETHGWTGKSIAELQEAILDRVIEQVKSRGVLLPGVRELIGLARRDGLPIGLATSSPSRLIEAVLGALDLATDFDATCSAESERYGKPHPAIFLRTAEALGVEPAACLVIEDSLNGVIAAKAAQMRCVAVPDAIHAHDPRFALADLRLLSLSELTEARWRELCA